MSEAMTNPDLCVVCGDDFGTELLKDGVCGYCANEADGYCACGSEPEPGYSMCGRCSEEEAADVRFHELYEEGLL